MKADDHLKPLAGFPGNEGLGFGAGRTTSPTLARFDPWSAIGGIAIVIDLLGRLAAERRMRAILVVPVDEQNKLTPEPLD